jgi:hypothetical protein
MRGVGRVNLRLSPTLLVGGFMVLVGAVLLAQNLGLPAGTAETSLGVLVVAAGGAVLGAALTVGQRWWVAITGTALVGLGLVMVVHALFPAIVGPWSNAIVLAVIGLVFLGGYVATPSRWWAIIPAGALLTLAAVAALGLILPADTRTGIFLVGLAITFAAVAAAPAPPTDRSWAWIPAALLAILGILALAASSAGRLLWPVIVIAVGVLLLVRAVRGPGAFGRR